MDIPWRDLGLVAAGAVVGAALRFGASVLVPSAGLPFPTFPWATLTVNIVGSLLIGAIMLPAGAEQGTKLLVVVGFLGALTTLSTYSFETVDLWRYGHRRLAFLNMTANGVGGPAAALIGWKIKTLFA